VPVTRNTRLGVGVLVPATLAVAWWLNPSQGGVARPRSNPIELLADPSFEYGGDAWHIGSEASFRQVRLSGSAHEGRRAVRLSKDEVLFQNIDVGTHRNTSVRGSIWVRGGAAELHMQTNCGPGVPLAETVTQIPDHPGWQQRSATLLQTGDGCSVRLAVASRGDIVVDEVSVVDPRLDNTSFESGSQGWAGSVTSAMRGDAFDGSKVGVLGDAVVSQVFPLDPAMEEYIANARIAVRRGGGSIQLVAKCPGIADRSTKALTFTATTTWTDVAVEFRETKARIAPDTNGCALALEIRGSAATEIDGALLELRTGPTTNGGGESHVGEETDARPSDVGGVVNQPGGVQTPVVK
jgi:hypothetical protein